MREKVTFINMHIKSYSLNNMCDVLGISKRTYFKYRAAEDKDYYDYLLIKEIFDESKGTPIDDSPIESFHSILKKETLYNNYSTSLQEYLLLVEDWLLFYNTSRIKKRKR